MSIGGSSIRASKCSQRALVSELNRIVLDQGERFALGGVGAGEMHGANRGLVSRCLSVSFNRASTTYPSYLVGVSTLEDESIRFIFQIPASTPMRGVRSIGGLATIPRSSIHKPVASLVTNRSASA